MHLLRDTVCMKKFISFCCACVAATGTLFSFGFSKAAPELTSGCRAAYLMDFDSGQCIYKENEEARAPIASVCKVMTLTLCLDAVESGALSLDDMVYISENASGMGGSQIFLDSGKSYPLTELIKSIVVCSANDSCVAVAEKISGSEEAFVADMNEKAAELGLDNTLFANCTGLPKDTQYSCAEDVAKMFANLLRHGEYFDYSRIWLEDFAHDGGRTTVMTNTNKLIRSYNGCDGGKTGFTNEAGFCLAATAKRENMRLISVVLGADTSEHRFSSAAKMLDYGFANYKNKMILDKTVTLNDDFRLRGGKKETYSVMPKDDCFIFSERGAEADADFVVTDFGVKAPVSKGQVVGKIDVYRGGVLYKSVDVVSAEDVKRAGFGDRLKAVAEDWPL